MLATLYNSIFRRSGRPKLCLPMDKAAQGTLVLGDSGTGKSQLLHQILAQARARAEPGVCYDPAAEFVQTHYRAGSDFILNPLDERFPNWQLAWEIESAADLDLIAESFFPTVDLAQEQTKFFNRAAQDIFKLLLAQRLSNHRMIETLGNPAALDALVKGTEVAHKIDPKAGSQRAAVLAVLVDAAQALRQIPDRNKSKLDFSFARWQSARGASWLFFTALAATRDRLRPLHAAWLNILLRKLLRDMPAAQGGMNGCWVIADEIHALNTLPALPTFIAECRKYDLRYILGTQSKHQLTQRYGGEAEAMLAQPILKIFYRCNEIKTAEWISACLGHEERLKPKITASTSITGHERASVNFANEIESRPVVSREQIMNLPNLHGYWKLEGLVVPFQLQPRHWEKVHSGFSPGPQARCPLPVNPIAEPTEFEKTAAPAKPQVAQSADKSMSVEPSDQPVPQANTIVRDF